MSSPWSPAYRVVGNYLMERTQLNLSPVDTVILVHRVLSQLSKQHVAGKGVCRWDTGIGPTDEQSRQYGLHGHELQSDHQRLTGC